MSRLRDLLQIIGEETIQLIDADIASKNIIRTGKLRNSIGYDIIDSGLGHMEIDFSMIYYGHYVDQGTGRIVPREFFDRIIRQQMRKYSKKIAKATIDDILFDTQTK